MFYIFLCFLSRDQLVCVLCFLSHLVCDATTAGKTLWLHFFKSGDRFLWSINDQFFHDWWSTIIITTILYENALDVFVESPGSARRCCVSHMQRHVPAQCHHREWWITMDKIWKLWHIWWKPTQCTLWCRHYSGPTCNAANVNRLWFALLGSGRDSLFLAERRWFHVICVRHFSQVSHGQAKIVRCPPGRQ